MRIGELARRTGVSRDAIRFYERQGLIEASAREADNNYKSYPEDAIFTLEVIRDAQAAGMTLGDLAILLVQLNAECGDEFESFDGVDFLTRKIEEIEARVAASERFLSILRQTRTALIEAPYSDKDKP